MRRNRDKNLNLFKSFCHGGGCRRRRRRRLCLCCRNCVGSTRLKENKNQVFTSRPQAQHQHHQQQLSKTGLDDFSIYLFYC